MDAIRSRTVSLVFVYIRLSSTTQTVSRPFKAIALPESPCTCRPRDCRLLRIADHCSVKGKRNILFLMFRANQEGNKTCVDEKGLECDDEPYR